VSATEATTYVVKLTPAGEFVWAAVFQECDAFHVAGLEVEPAGTLWVVGGFTGACDLDPGPGVTQATAMDPLDSAYIQLDATTGALLAGVPTNYGGEDYLLSVAFDDEGSRYLSGETVYVAPFVTKLDSTGATLWTKQYPSRRTVHFVSKPGGGLVGVGFAQRSRGPLPQGALVTALDPNGEVTWAFEIPGRDVGANGISANAEGFVLVGTQSVYPVDFDPSEESELVTTPGSFVSRYAF
jgi:hypothetical protein